MKTGTGPQTKLSPDHVLSVVQGCTGVFSSFAQIGFASGALPGLLVVIGIAAASRRHALWALFGAGFASFAHLLIGAHTSSFSAGLLGFNGALTAIALADYGIATIAAGVALSVVLQAFATYYGLPAMTAPFVLATWSMQWFANRFGFSRRMAVSAARNAAVPRSPHPEHANARRAIELPASAPARHPGQTAQVQHAKQ